MRIPAWIAKAFGRRAPAATPPYGASARPTYTTLLTGNANALLPREQNLNLLWQFTRGVPIMGRGLDILSGFVGVPKIHVEASEALEEELNRWAEEVEVGGKLLGSAGGGNSVGSGLKAWLPDHLRQSLSYGYGVGEWVATPQRNGVERLWSYDSRAFGIKSDAAGALSIYQSGTLEFERPLNPDTVLYTVHRPEGAGPYGTSLYIACPTFAQAVLDITHAVRQTWRRTGTPNFHVNWQANDPTTFQDPDGSIGAAVKAAMESGWNEAMRSAAIDGVTKDFFSTGNVTVTATAKDMEVMECQLDLRCMLEELIAATGIPPFLFGLSWSTTERMSGVQADLFATTIDCLRWMAEPALRQVINAHIKLSGLRVPSYTLEWGNMSLLDLEATSRAAQMDAAALLSRQKWALENWRQGFWSQEQAAAYVLDEEPGEIALALPLDAPVGVAPTNAPPENLGANSWPIPRAKALRESGGEYVGVGRCNGRH